MCSVFADAHHAMWKAKVVSIYKTSASKPKYKIEVVWFYGVSDVLDQLSNKKGDSKSTKAKKIELRNKINPEHYHPRELILSTHKQALDPACIIAVIDILHFRQECPRPHVLDGCYFYRTTYTPSSMQLSEPKSTCFCGQPYLPHCEPQVQRHLQKRWALSASAPTLVRFAMGAMRRGHPYTVEGDYGKVYQAQSILSALAEGDRERYDNWIRKHGLDGLDLVDPVSDPVHGWFLCPKCQHVI
ncbi:hypothetical protein J3R82DRAFT_9223 [Butyriboletus roseoflavus]|nr:hypothetical protein J3R82DRAFT_9223 [Butyriboletus roseoflavus]